MRYFLISSGLVLALIGLLLYFTRPPENILPEENIATEEIPQEDTTPKATVFYSGNEFTPNNVVVKDACLLEIVNKSEEPLLIRLNPHSEKNNIGVQYPKIAPENSLLLDPRYRIPQIGFHNHGNPNHAFSVTLDKECAEF